MLKMYRLGNVYTFFIWNHWRLIFAGHLLLFLEGLNIILREIFLLTTYKSSFWLLFSSFPLLTISLLHFLSFCFCFSIFLAISFSHIYSLTRESKDHETCVDDGRWSSPREEGKPSAISHSFLPIIAKRGEVGG